MSVIAQFRKKSGLTQRGLAEVLRIDRTTVAKWEAGKSFPKIKMLPELAKALNITVGQLIDEASINEKGA